MFPFWAVKRIVLLIFLCCSLVFTFAQKADTTARAISIVAGPQYKASKNYQKLWGTHYRKEWITPLAVQKVYLDKVAGGLTPYQSGGGRQSKTLRLINADKKEYVLRSIDKSFGKALPEIYQNTFIETLMNDQVSIGHPFSAVTIAPMAKAAKVYHTWPQIVYVPQQNALDTFNAAFGNTTYLLEQRPDENWEEAANFGHPEKISSTEKVLEKLREDGDNRVDQLQFIRSRLFDILIGDWGRHDDQWRWGSFKVQGKTIYKPIPRDRDQAYTKFDGVLLKLGKAAAGAGYLQSFEAKIKNVRTMNFPARNLDRQMANETTLTQWIETAKDIQRLLNDDVITEAVKKLPPEVFPFSGPAIILKLKARRNDLVKYAENYYKFLAEEVDIVGTEKDDEFKLVGLDKGKVLVQVSNKQNKSIFYNRTFSPDETEEIRLYGVDGKDIFELSGEPSPIRLRLVGTKAIDEYKQTGALAADVYDDRNQTLANVKEVHAHLSTDSLVHKFNYEGFQYAKKGLSPTIFFSDDDRFYVGLAYKLTTQAWRKTPFAAKHILYTHYSIMQSAFSFGYTGIYNDFIGKWKGLVLLNYDRVKWRNFYGLGNETVRATTDNNYYRLRTTEGLVGFGLEHSIGKQSKFVVNSFFQYIKVLKDGDRYLTKEFLRADLPTNFTSKNFLGASAALNLQKVDDLVLPRKGVTLFTLIAAAKNLAEPKGYINYEADLQFYIPIRNHFVLSIENGVSAVTGKPEFYQLNFIGGRRLRDLTGNVSGGKRYTIIIMNYNICSM